MNRAFRVIEGHPYWCQHKFRTYSCHNVQQYGHYFWNLRWYSIGKTANSLILTTTLQLDDSNLRNALFQLSRNNLYCQKFESYACLYISAGDSFGLCLLLFTLLFWTSSALSQEVLAENGFWHEIATQGHSRSFILRSVSGWQGVALAYHLKLSVKFFTQSSKFNITSHKLHRFNSTGSIKSDGLSYFALIIFLVQQLVWVWLRPI